MYRYNIIIKSHGDNDIFLKNTLNNNPVLMNQPI